MGYQNPKCDRGERVVAAAFAHVVDTFNDLTLASLYAGGAYRDGADARSLRRAGLVAPQEIASLEEPLTVFAQGAFSDNPYQETPFLRGIYFLAALDGSSARSSLLENLGFGPAPVVAAQGNGGLFVLDLLSRIMPNDRGQETELVQSRNRRRFTALAGIVLWFTLTGSAAVWLALSYSETFTSLKGIVEKIDDVQPDEGALAGNLADIVGYEKLIFELDALSNGLSIVERPYVGTINDMRRAMKASFVATFTKQIAEPIDKAMVMKLGDRDTISDEMEGEVIEQVTSRINLIGARLEGKHFDELMKMHLPSAGTVALLGQQIKNEYLEQLPILYVAAIDWEADESKLVAQRNRLRQWLEELSLSNDADFNWLVAWVDSSTDVPTVTMDNFWKGSRTLFGLASVPPGYTVDGMAAIDGYLDEIDKATGSSMKFQQKRGEFEEWFWRERLAVWKKFIAEFTSGAALLYGQDEWKRTVQGVTLPSGPHFSLAARVKKEFAADAKRTDIPDWLEMAFTFDAIKALGDDKSNVIKEANLFTRLIKDLSQAFGAAKSGY